MEFQEIRIKNYKDVISKNIREKNEVCMYAIVPKTLVYRGMGSINIEYCKNNNIEVYDSVDFGGGIVATKGDIVFIIIKKEGWDIGKLLLKELNEFLLSKGLNSSIDNNDIVIDDKYKAISYSSVDVGDRFIYTGLQISFNSDAEQIKNICLKESIKTPRGLAYYNISCEETFTVLKDYLKSLK